MKPANLVLETAEWLLGRSDSDRLQLGLGRMEALESGRVLLSALAAGATPVASIDSIHAAVGILGSEKAPRCEIVVRLHDIISHLANEDPEEVAELLIETSFHGWRHARRLGAWAEAIRWRSKIREVADSASPTRERVRDFVADLPRRTPPKLFSLAEIVVVSDHLAEAIQRSPGRALERLKQIRLVVAEAVDHPHSDARLFMLGDLALQIGICHRQLSQRQEATAWFFKSQKAFEEAGCSTPETLRLEYHRLVSLLEQRHLDEVSEAWPELIGRCRELGLVELELKVSFLPALVFMERGDFSEALIRHNSIIASATELGFDRLLAYAYTNMAHIHGMSGEAETALVYIERARPILQRLGDEIGLAKLQWGVAARLASKGSANAAIKEYEVTRSQLAALGLRAEAADVDLVIADLHLEVGNNEAALSAILKALPVIDAFELMPEGKVAMALLRGSVRGKRINRDALGQVRRSVKKTRQPESASD